MSRNQRIIFIAILAVFSVGIVWWQYRLHRLPVPSAVETVDREVKETDGVKHSIPLDQIVSDGTQRDGIPPIDQPSYESVPDADQYLADDGYGLDVEVNGLHRFYPYQILVWHEIVNETFAGKSLLITYSPLCFSGLVYERAFGEETIVFGTSGQLWNNNPLLYDQKTESLWSQALGEAVVGEVAGMALKRYPSSLMQWKDWKRTYPDGRVLSKDTGVVRDYTLNPYDDYARTSEILFPLSAKDSRLPSKEIVYGVSLGKTHAAYALQDIKRVRVINDVVGLPLVVVYDSALNVVRGFVRSVDDQVLTFGIDDDNASARLVDQETGSAWTYDGRAVSGPLRNSQLEPLILQPSFWFSWMAVHPDTSLERPE